MESNEINEKEFNSEKMNPIYLAEGFLIKPDSQLYRVDSKGDRVYYRYNEFGEPEFFISVTTFIKKTTPTSTFLIKWMADKGYDEAKLYTQERADYGTFMHMQIADLLMYRCYDLDSLNKKLKEYIEYYNLPSSFINHADELKKDVAAFAQFMKDRNIRPLAIEIVLAHPEFKFAGALDLVCSMDIEEKGFFGEVYKSGDKKGQPKESKQTRSVRAIVDFKSGRNGFYIDHEIQLGAYKEMWNYNYPELQIEKIFNWSPKDWRTRPDYNLKDQTDSKHIAKIPHLLQIASIEDGDLNRAVTVCKGIINIDSENGISDNVHELLLSDIIKNIDAEREAEKETIDESTEVVKDENVEAEDIDVEQNFVDEVITASKNEAGESTDITEENKEVEKPAKKSGRKKK